MQKRNFRKIYRWRKDFGNVFTWWTLSHRVEFEKDSFSKEDTKLQDKALKTSQFSENCLKKEKAEQRRQSRPFPLSKFKQVFSFKIRKNLRCNKIGKMP